MRPGTSRSNGNIGKGTSVIRSGKTITRAPRLKPGQVRCHACRNTVTLTSTGNYRGHHDLFGGPCDARRPQVVDPTELPPVMHRGQPVTSGLTTERVRVSKPSFGEGVRLYGDCEDCGAFVTGERRFCGLCLVRHEESRRRPS